MNCLAQRKRFKNKQPVWNDINDSAKDEISEPKDIIDEQVDEDPDSEDDDAYDMYANDVRSKKLTLGSNELQFKHLTNINNDRSYSGAIKQVKFHPKSKIALVSLSYGEADLYEVDGERNKYIQNIKLPRTRTPFCAFKPDGDSIVISSETYKGSFFAYDMISGHLNKYALKVGIDAKDMTDFTLSNNYMACRKEGKNEVIGLSSKTFENTFSIKINEPVRVVKFNSNESEIYIAGENAQTYVWDLRKTSICKHKFQDEGSVHTTSFAISETSNLISVGSDSGFVNTYELEQCMTKKFPSPVKTFNNLKTSIDILEFNKTGELLLVGSSEATGGFRMIHTHSGVIYKNFPVSGKKYGHLLSADFSPLSGYLSLGCSSGRAHLCRIPYYKSY